MSGLIRRGKMYYIVFRKDGRERRISLKTSNRAEARRRKEVFERQLANREWETEERDCAVEKFWKRYEPYAEAHKRPNTVDMERISWRQFIKEFQPKTLGAVTQKQIEDFKQTWLAAGKAPKTVNNFLTNLRLFYNYAYSLKDSENCPFYTGPNPFKGARKVPKEEAFPKFLNLEQVDNVLMIAREHGQDIFLVFAIGIYAGLRKNEIVNSRWEWIDWRRKTITVSPGIGFVPKNRKPRAIPLSSKLLEILRPHKQKDGYIIESSKESANGERYRYEPRTAFGNVAREAGIDWLTLHVLRHTFISLHCQAGTSIFKVSQWAGHADVSTTARIYAHLQKYDKDIDNF